MEGAMVCEWCLNGEHNFCTGRGCWCDYCHDRGWNDLDDDEDCDIPPHDLGGEG
jgi:hypothetical protein